MKTLIYATRDEGYLPVLRDSAVQFGFDLSILGWGEAWPGSAGRMQRYHEALLACPANEVVMLLDAYDAFFVGPAAETRRAFESMGVPFLFSSQRYFPASPLMRRLADGVMGLEVDGALRRKLEREEAGRPCMGAWMGRAGPLRELLAELVRREARLRSGHDQIALNDHLQEHPEDLHLDRSSAIFHSLWRTRQPFPLRGTYRLSDPDAELRVLPGGRVCHRITGTCPQVIHAPFDLNVASLLERLGWKTEEVRRVSARRYLDYSIRSYLAIFVRRLFARGRAAGGGLQGRLRDWHAGCNPGTGGEETAVPYDSIAELPKAVRENLPKPAQQTYRRVFNSAWKEYADPKRRRRGASREETAHKVAWAAVKESYEKRGGRWVQKT